ncbi:hypothetical protein [Streptomyces sp. SLBN-115]|uniref:hypothetical protein n=1 Tax=Streptomyces sp. SLBN-115 TaxID=2768453 RepID=UPI00114F1FA8|nr:hypothetical protein [Streptomyces sp. SLBN-115]TQJ54672.1 hypothetical protein FBY34_2455 [Streptomyces sp. SLBN-115]
MADESSDFIQQKKAELNENDARLELEKRCTERGIETAWVWQDPTIRFRIAFPNGRNKRWQFASEKTAADFLSIDFPDITYLGDFDAILLKDKQTIEAYVLMNSGISRMQDLPGVRKIGYSQMELSDLDEDVEIEQKPSGSRLTMNDAWILEFSPTPDRPDLRVELGSASREFSVFSERYRRRGTFRAREREPLPYGLGRFCSIRISGINVTRHDEALDILNRISGAVFFELDLQYGTDLILAPSETSDRARLGTRVQQEKAQETPRNPQNQYPEKPLSLYWYGRGASGLPLLEYLAYYQVLEYFFPSFSHRDTLTKLRNELLDPRFRPDDDSNLVRIINLTSGTGKGFGSEREQLRSTISGCVTEDHVRDFVSGNSALSEHFSGKQKIKDVANLTIADRQNDLLTSVANRVYEIRCRIVHAKEDGGKSSVDLLLPFSREAEALGPDIELVKFLAQKVLITGASRLRL